MHNVEALRRVSLFAVLGDEKLERLAPACRHRRYEPLVESAEEIDGQWIVALGSEEIARSVAASREMVSRVVKKMKADGLVRRERRKTVILNWARMTGASAAASG